MKTRLALFSALLAVACSSRNQAPYQSSQPVEAPFTELLPMAYVFPQMPYTVAVLQKDGKIVPHAQVKNYAVRFDRGSWTVRGKRVVIKYQTFNAYGCEVKPCSTLSKEQSIELDLDEQKRIVGLRTFNAPQAGFDQLYFNESVVKDAPEYFK